MQEQLLRWIEAPTVENFQTLCQIVAENESYNPYSTDLEDAEELLEEEKYEEAMQGLMEEMTNLILSPHVHLLLAYAAHQLGDTQRAETESNIAALLLECFLETGDGSWERPYRVLRVSDEYDILRYLDKQTQLQSLHEDGERHLDCQQCTDGTNLWFDITVPHRRLGELLKAND